MIIRSIKEFEDYRNNELTNSIVFYRGQANIEWSICSTLLRNSRCPFIKERFLYKKFLKYTNGIQPSIYKNCQFTKKWYDLFQMQHIGYHTRFIDVSNTWDVSLYFAVNDYPDKDGVLYLFKIPKEKKRLYFSDKSIEDKQHIREILNKDPFKIKDIIFINPSFDSEMLKNQGEKNRSRQMGSFIVTPLHPIYKKIESLAEFQDVIIKMIIPASSKSKIKSELEQRNIDQPFLFSKKMNEHLIT